jgi:hypothetical protein
MDAVNTERDRDRSVERVLGQALRAAASAEESAACLDAETLAAWADSGLTASDLATVETHLSECSRCQSLVATLERTRPAGSEREPWWPPSFGVGWLVPLTAAAAAILLWVALPGNVPARSPASLDVQMKIAPAGQVPAGARGAPQMPGTAAPGPREPSLAESRQSPAVVPEEARAPAAGRAEARADFATAAPSGTSDARTLDERGARKPDEGDARKENRTAGQEPMPVDRLGSVSAPGAVPSARTPAADRTAAAAEVSAAQTSALQGQARARAIARDIASPDPLFRWRIGAAGVVEHSTDGGSTWEVLPTGVVAELTAGTSPSPSVCWLVGRAGTVLLSTDGRRWRRVAFPEATDLVGVQASDSRTVTVTTADGRTFRTADGGVTWDRRPLQEF